MFSPNVDPYVNSIAHCYDNMDVSRVCLVHVKDTTTGLSSDEVASTTFNQIWLQIEGLSKGFYTNYRKRDAEGNFTQTAVASSKVEIYQRINSRLLDRQLIPIVYKNLKEGVTKILQNHGGKQNCILDLTAASKVPSIDLFATSLALSAGGVHVFELDSLVSREHPENSLYHALNEKDYSYTNLLSSPPVKASLEDIIVRTPVLMRITIVFAAILLLSFGIFFFFGLQSAWAGFLGIISSLIAILTVTFTLIEKKQKL